MTFRYKYATQRTFEANRRVFCVRVLPCVMFNEWPIQEAVYEWPALYPKNRKDKIR